MKKLHPYVSAAFFIMVAAMTMLCRHPVFVGISLAFAFINAVMEGGRKALKFNLLYLLPVMILTALINPLFNHRGITVLARFPGGNALTAESLIYGIFAGMMLGAIVAWFSYHNKVMTSDKLCFLFGRLAPSLSLFFSMTLRFVPLMGNKLKRIIISRRCLYAQPDKSYKTAKASKKHRIKEGLRICSVMVDRGLETAVTTSDSMKSRGYGCGRRSFFSIFSFGKRDGLILAAAAALMVYIVIGSARGCLSFEYYPAIKFPEITVYSVSVVVAFAVLCAMPLFLRKYENQNK